MSALTKQAARIDAFVVPVVTFASATVFFALAAASVHYSPFRVSTWSRWDSGHYVAIARSGYKLANAGWMPAYPALIRLVHSFGLPFGVAAIVVADSFSLATLLLLWNGFLDRGKSAGSVGCMLLAAFFPGAVYHHVMFPISMVTFFVLLTIWLLGHGRWILAGLAGAVAAAGYSTGFVVAAAIAVAVLWRSTGRLMSRAGKAAVGSGLVLCGLGATLLMQKITIGRWDGLFYVQRKYSHGLHNPVTTLWNIVRPAFTGGLGLPNDTPVLQTLIVFVFVAVVVFLWVVAQKPRVGAETYALVAGLAFWLTPLILSAGTSWRALGVSLYRGEALLVPLVLIARRLPAPVLFATAIGFIVLAFVMGQLFFNVALV